MRGEKVYKACLKAQMAGSPPHARGKVARQSKACVREGITPACAGKSVLREHQEQGQRGSPPHARGKALLPRLFFQIRRITPACAGKRRLKTHSSSITWDHPRMRGEKKGVQVKRTDEQGSPPHARGKVDHGLFLERLNGITPACAGKSSSRLQTRFPVWDHPRMRGEKRKGNCTISARPGSPPHARGKVLGLEQKNPPEGITPACAGKSKE